jgi:hypothetical protein
MDFTIGRGDIFGFLDQRVARSRPDSGARPDRAVGRDVGGGDAVAIIAMAGNKIQGLAMIRR